MRAYPKGCSMQEVFSIAAQPKLKTTKIEIAIFLIYSACLMIQFALVVVLFRNHT